MVAWVSEHSFASWYLVVPRARGGGCVQVHWRIVCLLLLVRRFPFRYRCTGDCVSPTDTRNGSKTERGVGESRAHFSFSVVVVVGGNANDSDHEPLHPPAAPPPNGVFRHARCDVRAQHTHRAARWLHHHGASPQGRWSDCHFRRRGHPSHPAGQRRTSRRHVVRARPRTS